MNFHHALFPKSQLTMSSLKKDDQSSADERVLDSTTVQEIHAEQDAHVGVKTVEAAGRVFGKYSRWALFIGYVACRHLA